MATSPVWVCEWERERERERERMCVCVCQREREVEREREHEFGGKRHRRQGLQRGFLQRRFRGTRRDRDKEEVAA